MAKGQQFYMVQTNINELPRGRPKRETNEHGLMSNHSFTFGNLELEENNL